MLNPKDVRIDSFRNGIMAQFAGTHLPTGLTVHGGTQEGVLRALDAAVASAGWQEEGHAYVSTACLHGMHSRCIKSCKFCEAPCGCGCDHGPQDDMTLMDDLARHLGGDKAAWDTASKVLVFLSELPRSK
jgi:hypothetical protein